MTEETNNGINNYGSEPYVVNPDSIKTTYHHYGKQAARNLNSNAKSLGAALANIYNQFLIDQELNEEGISQRVKRLQGEVLQKQNQKLQLNAEIETGTQFKEAKEKKIEELEVEKIKARSGEAGSSDMLPFSIGVMIVILLTLYLIVFYSSTGYSAFYGVAPGSLGFINPNVFAEAISKGGGVIALIILFPVIFLGLGFLIHDSLEHGKYAIIIGLLFFTFLTDAIIGYKIAQAIHNNEYNAGLANTTWQFEMIYNDINFYLILALGFVVYVIWGGLLNYVLNKYKDIQPDRATELKIENLDRKINENRGELTEAITKMNIVKSQIAILQNEIVDKEKDIIGYQNGLIPG